MDDTFAPRRRRGPIIGSFCALAIIAALVLVTSSFAASGGRWFVVRTPSMGRSAPVGTLLLTEPRPAGSIRVGDVIAFRPPGVTTVYTHRVVAVTAKGLRTRGDLNGAADGWTIAPARVIGVVTHRLWGIGWLLRAVPYLLLGWALVWLATRVLVRGRWRAPARLAGCSLVITLVGFLLHPFVGAQLVDYAMDGAGDGLGVRVQVVSTGLLPIRVHAAGGSSVDLINGELGVVRTGQLSERGFFAVHSALHMPVLWWWVVVVLICLSPLLWCLTVGLAPVEPIVAGRHGPTAGLPTSALVVALVATAVLPLVPRVDPPAGAAFAASVRNPNDRAGSRTYFTCQAAETSTGNPAFVAYPMRDTGATAADISGNGRTGSYPATPVRTTTATGCTRDPAGATVFNGSSTCLSLPVTALMTAPNVFSEEVWFSTTVGGGTLVGWATSRTGVASLQYDRHIYLDATGHLYFGVYPGSAQTISSPAGYLDGAWHQVIATLSGAGMALYLDSTLVASQPAVTAGEADTGWFRFGCSNTGGWPNDPAPYFTGQLAYGAVYLSALTAQQVREHYLAGAP